MRTYENGHVPRPGVRMVTASIYFSVERACMLWVASGTLANPQPGIKESFMALQNH